MNESSSHLPRPGATRARSPHRRGRGHWIGRIVVCVVLAHALATLMAIVLSVHQFNGGVSRRMLVERRGAEVVEVGHVNRSLGIDRYTVVFLPTPFNPEPPTVVVLDPVRHRLLDGVPGWVGRSLPGEGGAHLPATMRASQVGTNAIGWPFRMYRGTRCYWTDEALREAFLKVSGLLPVSHSSGDTPFRCPIIHGTVGLTPSGPYLGITHWGSIESYHFTAALPSFLSKHAKLPDAVPITPIWFGTLANTVLFAAMLWGAGCAWVAVVRFIARRRHPGTIPCAGCGYDLKGLTRAVCPECGEACPDASVGGADGGS